MTIERRTALRDDVCVGACPGGVELSSPRGRIRLVPRPAAWQDLLSRKGHQPATRTAWIEHARAQGGQEASAHMDRDLRCLSAAGMLVHVIELPGGDVLHVEPMASRFEFDSTPWPSGQPRSPSRFAHLRWLDGRTCLEDPTARVRVRTTSGLVAAVMSACAEPMRLEDLPQRVPGWPRPDVLQLARVLAAVGLLRSAPTKTRAQEQPPQTWAFHDLLLHMRARMGTHDQGYGGTRRFDAQLRPAPVVAPVTGPLLALERPKADLGAHDAPFQQVLEARQSQRDHADNPLDRSQLGEFLYRSARVRQRRSTPRGEFSRRPYPSAGATHPLEVHLAVGRCDGLERGLYRYEPEAHALEQRGSDARLLSILLGQAGRTAGGVPPPQILVILAARFDRTFIKYESIGYALILKDVGVLLQTMALTATAMGLAGCILGGGDAELFAAASGRSLYEEGSVGEFMLGTPAVP
ncbi:MAG: SagB family peptide dehydrogenase [Deltaproteobacteria bacterium]|nr:SagB family peptide dehydrogenase [Deltaproteobacteria bacterium]